MLRARRSVFLLIFFPTCLRPIRAAGLFIPQIGPNFLTDVQYVDEANGLDGYFFKLYVANNLPRDVLLSFSLYEDAPDQDRGCLSFWTVSDLRRLLRTIPQFAIGLR